jgi:probable tyrosine recombinase xerC-like
MVLKGRSRSTIEHHEYKKVSIVEFLQDKNIEDITSSDISAWYKFLSKTRSQNTVRNYISTIREVLDYMNLRGSNCLKKALIPAPKRLDHVPEFLTPEEVSVMIENASSLRNKCVISLLYSSGIRLSELINLNRGQIVNKRFTVIGKGSKARLCFIDERTEDLLNEYLESRNDNCDALIISVRYKQRMTATNIQLLIKNSARNAGISKKVTPHTLRHSFATNLLVNNVDIRYIGKMLGHSSIQTTMQYTHVVDNDLENRYRMGHTI